MNILLAVDGSPYTKKMLAYLVTHEGFFATSNTYTLLNVQAALPPRVRGIVGKDIVEKYLADESEKVLAPVSKFLLRHGIDAKSERKVGHAGEIIGKFAEAGRFDLLVMGSHGHGAVLNLVMGSVANKVLAQCGTPLLIVR